MSTTRRDVGLGGGLGGGDRRPFDVGLGILGDEGRDPRKINQDTADDSGGDRQVDDVSVLR